MDYDNGLTFSHFAPTRVVFGQGALGELGLLLKPLGVTRVLLVTDAVLRQGSDLCARAAAALGTRLAGIYDGVLADSPAPCVDAGAELGRSLEADGVVSLGGGSVIDAAKGIALLLREGGTIAEHQGSGRLARPVIPHIAIPTTAGTGSEVSPFAVIADPVAQEKMHYMDEHLLPAAAILDPALTVSLPARLTAATGMDALTHGIEAYLSANRDPISDAAALHAIRLIARWLPVAVTHGDDLVARGQMLIASNLAGQAFCAAGVGLAHAIAHVVGARHHVHHGTANAVCLPSVMRFNAVELGERVRDIGVALGLAPSPTVEAGAEAAAEEVARLTRTIGLPTRLRDVGVPEEELPALAEGSLSDGAIVYSGRFAAEHELVLGVYRQAY